MVADSNFLSQQLNVTNMSTITQAELVRLIELRQCLPELKALRDSILQRLGAGADIQPGMFTAAISTNKSKRISARSLREVMSSDEVLALKARINPSTTQTLRTKLTGHALIRGEY